MDIENIVKDLSPESRQRIAARLEQLMEEEVRKEMGWTMGEYYVATMEELLGVPLDRSRSLDIVYARAVIAFCLYEIGWTESKIGRLLGRDHSTIHYYRVMVKDALAVPASNKPLSWLYKKFLDTIGQ